MKVLLTLMVKNESRILQRCMEAAAKYADAVLVCDTGSTDNTVEIAKAFPAHVAVHEWQNFGHNRSLSFTEAVKCATSLGWDLSQSYALVIDGDMILKGEDYHPLLKGDDGYRIVQKTPTLEYLNTRFLKLSVPWKCVGVTHEYWSGGNVEDIHGDVWIDDVGDGGCKSDKIERDIRLLTKGLEDEPGNGRYMFYLAQSYRDGGDIKNAIRWYKNRIKTGGWEEEVWYAHYAIATCYARINNLSKLELWVNRAYERRPGRNEPLYLMIKTLREKGQQFKAWHYLQLARRNPKPPTTDVLFMETHTYGYLLDYEETILRYYVSENRDGGMDLSMKYIGNEHPLSDSVFSNIIFYTKPINLDWKRLTFPTQEGYVSTSLSVNQSGLANIRTVNYWVTPEGDFKNPGVVDTRNYTTQWDPFMRQWNGFTEIQIPKSVPRRDDIIRGLEDIRLQGNMFTATTKEFSYCDKYRIVVGSYPDMKNFTAIHPPTETECEKNWLLIDNTTVIYNWHPLQIGEIVLDQLNLTTVHNTPPWFRHVRGSAPPFMYKGDLWVMVHVVKYERMRKYMHQFVVLDGKTYKPKSMTRPFYFKQHGVEYSLCARVWDDTLHIFSTIMERETWNGTMPMSECVKSLVPISG